MATVDLSGLCIKDYAAVFRLKEAQNANEVTWTKFPVARNSTSYRRLMRDARGRGAFAVFIGILRLVSRGKTDGALVVKGHQMTTEDIEAETGIPTKVIEDGLVYLQHPSIGWLLPGCAPVSNRPCAGSEPADNRPTTGRAPGASFSSSGLGISSSSGEQEISKPPRSVPEKKAALAELQFPDGLDTPEFKAKWADWTTYRRERRLQPYTPRSAAAQLRRCAGWGAASSLQAIDLAIANAWQGLFEPKGNTHGRGKQPGVGAGQRRSEKAGREYDEGHLALPLVGGGRA